MTTRQCPVCGRPLAPMDEVLAEHDSNYQCHHCWNRVNAAIPASKRFSAERRGATARGARQRIIRKEKH